MKCAMKYLAIMISMVGLTACTQAFKPQTSDIPSHVQVAKAQPMKAKGAIWSESTTNDNLFADVKAHGLNDIVTILVEETTAASGKANTKTGRDNSVNLGVDNFLGKNLNFKSFLGIPGTGPFTPSVGATSSSAFTGSGTTTRSGSLKGVITARVIEVLPNGNLVVRGTREMVVNDEKQTMALTGVIRPQDIASDNSISSTMVADARIEYGGNGIVADQQEQGWLSRVLGWIWPF